DGLDAKVRAGEAPTNALMVSALLAPAVEDLLYEPEGAEPRGDVAPLIDERARPILESMRASRRDSERARQILLAQRRLAPSKRRRGRPMALVRRDWFGEALAVFELMHPGAEGEVADEIARWHRLLREAHLHPQGSPEEPLAPGEEPRKRRRRR